MTPLGFISAGIMDSSVSYFLLLCAGISGLNIAKSMILEPQKTTDKTIRFILVPALLFALAIVAWLNNSRIPLFLDLGGYLRGHACFVCRYFCKKK